MYVYVTDQHRQYAEDKHKSRYLGIKPTYLRGLLGPDGWTESIQNDTDNLMPDIISDSLHKFAVAGLIPGGFTSFRFHTEKLWMNTQRRQITVDIVWAAQNLARWEVVEPVYQLFRWATPGLDSDGNLSKIKDKFAETVKGAGSSLKELSGIDVESSTEAIAEKTQSKLRGVLSPPSRIRMQIGRTQLEDSAITMMDPCIITNVSPKWEAPWDSLGFPQRVVVSITFEEVWTPTTGLWPTYGFLSGHGEAAAAYGSWIGSLSPFFREELLKGGGSIPGLDLNWLKL